MDARARDSPWRSAKRAKRSPRPQIGLPRQRGQRRARPLVHHARVDPLHQHVAASAGRGPTHPPTACASCRRTSGGANVACGGQRGGARQLHPGQPERAGRQRVLVGQRRPGDRAIVRVQAHAHAAAEQRRERMARGIGHRAGLHVAPDGHRQMNAAVAQLGDQRRDPATAPTPCAMRSGASSASASRTAGAPPISPAWVAIASPASRATRTAGASDPNAADRLVARDVEGDDAAAGPRRGAPRLAHRPLLAPAAEHHRDELDRRRGDRARGLDRGFHHRVPETVVLRGRAQRTSA